jgi:hypothetical protein
MAQNNVCEIAELIIKSIKEEATTEDVAILQKWLEEDRANRQFYEELNNSDFLSPEYRDFKSVSMEEARKKLWNFIGLNEI